MITLVLLCNFHSLFQIPSLYSSRIQKSGKSRNPINLQFHAHRINVSVPVKIFTFHNVIIKSNLKVNLEWVFYLK